MSLRDVEDTVKEVFREDIEASKARQARQDKRALYTNYDPSIRGADMQALRDGYITSDVPVEGCTKYRYYDNTGKVCYLYCNYDPTIKGADCKTMRLLLIPLILFFLFLAFVVPPLEFKLAALIGLCILVFVFVRVKGRIYIPYAFKVESEDENTVNEEESD